MESIKNMNDLVTGQMYVVVGYSDPINSEYLKDYILLVSEENSTEYFEMWAPNFISEYFCNKKPKGKFTFVVNEENGIKYPVVEHWDKKCLRTFVYFVS